jgi:hypothetical protein
VEGVGRGVCGEEFSEGGGRGRECSGVSGHICGRASDEPWKVGVGGEERHVEKFTVTK